MTRQIATSDAASQPSRFTDAFVIFSVTVLSMAAGAWMLAWSGLPLWSVMVAVLAIYSVLLCFHLLVRRSLVGDGPAAAIGPDETDWMQGASVAAGRAPQLRLPDADRGEAAPQPVQRKRPERTRRPEAIAVKRGAPEQPVDKPADPFGYRPSRTAQALRAEPGLTPAPAVPRDARIEPPRLPSVAPSEVNVEIIQDLIKKLADELNDAAEAEPLPAPVSAEGISAESTEAMIGSSVAALEAAARTMRTTADEAPPAAAAPSGRGAEAAGEASDWWPRIPDPAPAAGAMPQASTPPALNPQLARIAEAVATERMEVMIEPIQALTEGRARHFEVSVRLLTADGASLEQSEFARTAQGCGLMPRIDAARMIRAARLARRLGERGRQGALLAAIAGESLTDTAFLDVARAQSGEGAMELVLSFLQSEVRAFTPGHAQALDAMAAAGLRFALEEITNLDMDFGALKHLGFEFVKLDAPVFLEGLPAAGGDVPASDICRHLADFGLTVIVGRIEDDWLLARILGFGVQYGKGTLFGGPTHVPADVLAEQAAA